MATTTTKGSGGDPTTTTTTAYYSQLPTSSPPSQDPNNPHFHHQHHHFHHHHPHPHPDHQDQQCYILLPPYPRRRFRYLNRSLSCFFSILLFSIAIFLLWPSDPDLKIVRLRLNNVHIHTSPSISMDISVALTVKVHNRDFYSLDYRSFVVSIAYRGRQLGSVNSKEGHMKARSSSYVNATLQLNGIEILHDVFYLLEDLAKGSIPFDTVSEIQGQLGLLFFKVPIKAKVSCEIDVNTDNQTVIRQNCYPN